MTRSKWKRQWRRQRKQWAYKFLRKLDKRLNQFDQKSRKKRQNAKLSRVNWQDHLDQLKNNEFAERYRMSQEILNFLLTVCQKVSNFFCELNPQQSASQERLYGCDGIDPRHKLAAGDSYMDIRLVHGMSKASMYKYVWAAVDAINESNKLAFKFP